MAAAAPLRPISCIAVETSRRLIDDDWLLRYAAGESEIVGVVLNLQPDLSGFADRLDKYVAMDKFVGIRLRPIDCYDLHGVPLATSLRQLERHAKSVEFGADTPQRKRAFAHLAAKYPTTVWILDHCGHPHKDSGLQDEWLLGIKEISTFPNVMCKVTGKYLWDTSWRDVLDKLLEVFGTERLMYGSNWPVTSLPDDIALAVGEVTAILGVAAEDFFYHNSRRAYRLATAAGDDTFRGYQ